VALPIRQSSTNLAHWDQTITHGGGNGQTGIRRCRRCQRLYGMSSSYCRVLINNTWNMHFKIIVIIIKQEDEDDEQEERALEWHGMAWHGFALEGKLTYYIQKQNVYCIFLEQKVVEPGVGLVLAYY
jgi:RNA polymerase subunit RPABC4/transcription elongation factor Spt4